MTPNLSLTLLTLSDAPYVWSETLNNNFEVIDSHTHAEGDGAPVFSSFIVFKNNKKINSYIEDVSFLNFTDNTEFSSTKNGFFVQNGDLFCYDGENRKIQITAGDVLYYLSSSGQNGIGGDYITASAVATYSATDEKYSFFDGSSNLSTIICDAAVFETLTSFDSFESGDCSIQANLSNIFLNLPNLSIVSPGTNFYPVLLNISTIITTQAALGSYLDTVDTSNTSSTYLDFYIGFNFGVSTNTISSSEVCFVCDNFSESSIVVDSSGTFIDSLSFFILPGFIDAQNATIDLADLYNQNKNPIASSVTGAKLPSFLFSPYISIEGQGSIKPIDAAFNANGDQVAEIRTAPISKLPYGSTNFQLTQTIFPGGQVGNDNTTAYPYFLLSLEDVG